MAGECPESPEATAPKQSCAGASADGARSGGNARAATHPKTTSRDPMVEVPSAALLNGRGRSFLRNAASVPATPTPLAQTADAERG